MGEDELNYKLSNGLPVAAHTLESSLAEAQHQLQAMRERYAALYDSLPVGCVTLDAAGVIQEINVAAAAMLEVQPEHVLGAVLTDFIAAPYVPTFLACLSPQVVSSVKPGVEIHLKFTGGIPRIIKLQCLAASVHGCQLVMTDVTEQRHMSLALQVNRSAQDALLNAIPALVYYLDNDLRYLNCSQVFAEFIGRPIDEITGHSVFDLFAPAVAQEWYNIAASVLQTGMALYGFENSLPDAKGALVHLSTVLAPFLDDQGKTIGLVGVSIDISMIKSAANINSELLVQNRKLTRNLFTAHEEERRHLAHELHDELGQWFTAIQAEAQIICNVAKHDAKIHSSAQAIGTSASRVHEVIRGMLRHLRPSLLDELGLADSLRELLQQWSHSQPDVVCEFNLAAELEELGEELNVTIYRIVQEALNNVVGHARANKVVVSLHQDCGQNNNRFLVLKVDDNGIGFESKKTRAGIGLLGMRERVIAAGGDFFIDSAPGEGTNVLARLPVNKRQEAEL
jgi:PAS domain S-box-containing protein